MISGFFRRFRGRLAGPLALVVALCAAGELAAAPDRDGDPQPIRVSMGAVAPGVVTTSVVVLPDLFGTAPGTVVRYRLEALGEARLFGELEGEISGADLQDPVLPITYSVPRMQLAGPVLVARVHFEAATGQTWSGELGVDVVADARLEMAIATAAPEVAPGSALDLEYSLINLGNAADTVVVELEGATDWSIESRPAPVVIAPGQKIVDTIRLRAPSTATPGDRQLVRLIARGIAAVARTEALIAMSFAEVSANYAFPVRVFTGATRSLDGIEDGTLDWSAVGSGEIAEGTTFSVSARSRSALAGRSAFVGHLAGPSFWASLRRPGWQIAAGEIFQASDPVTGAYSHGTGASGSWSRGALSGSASYLESNSLFSGRVMSGDVVVKTGIGDLGFAVRGEDRGAIGEAGPASLQGGAFTFRRRDESGFNARGSAGFVRVDGADGTVVRPVVQADVSRSTERGSLTFRARRMPNEATLFDARTSELFAGGTLELGRGFAATGWYSNDDLSSRTDGTAGSANAASAGLRYNAGTFQAALRGTTGLTRVSGIDSTAARRNALAVDLTAALGGLTAGLTAERDFAARSLAPDYLQGSLQGRLGGSWTSLTGTYAAPIGAEPVTRIDLVQSFELPRVRLDLAAGTSPTGDLRETSSAWARAETGIGFGVSMVAGAEYFPTAGIQSPLRLSLGFERNLSVPLPTRRPAAVAGLAFHDLDGDGLRGADEPGFAGLMIRQGTATVTTNSAGAFEMRAGGGAISIDSGSLLNGFMVPTGALGTVGPKMEIPVVQTGRLSLDFFLDADRDGSFDQDESRAGGLIVVLTHQSGVRYTDGSGDEGSIQFRAIAPGSYTGTIAGTTLYQDVTFEVVVASGGEVQLNVPVETIEREVRFGPTVAAF